MDLVSNMEDPLDVNKNIWIDYQLSASQSFRKLGEIKARGWANQEGDRYFARQRRNADHATVRGRQFFFEMMKRIGNELENRTRSLSLNKATPWVLDLCMAPGGYTASALKFNPSAHVTAVTLPVALGGHEILVPHGPVDARVHVEFADINMLVGELGICEIPAEHPEAADFVHERKLPLERAFDLIFCDGQVLRTHHRAPYRERTEATRLLHSQLIIALTKVQPAGTIIILLHKVDNWHCAELIFTFKRFAQVQLFKPLRSHEKRSSFYLVAPCVDPEHNAAKLALVEWRTSWLQATLSTPEQHCQSADNIRSFISDHGESFVQMAEPIWDIQFQALAKCTFV